MHEAVTPGMSAQYMIFFESLSFLGLMLLAHVELWVKQPSPPDLIQWTTLVVGMTVL